MARTKRTPTTPAQEPGFRVVEVPIKGARSFVTFGPESAVWLHPIDSVINPEVAGVDGNFVRLEAPKQAPEELVEQVRAACRLGGAIKVIVAPRRRGRVVVESKDKRPHLKARAVVEQLIAEANVDDRNELAAFCEVIMAARGM